MDTETEIRERAEQEKNETPDVVDAGDSSSDGGDQDGDPSSYGGIPTPSISRKHLLVVGAILGLYIAWKLYQSTSDSTSGTGIDDARTAEWDPDVGVEDEELEREDIEVPQSADSPLAGDKAVTEEFRKRGIINEMED